MRLIPCLFFVFTCFHVFLILGHVRSEGLQVAQDDTVSFVESNGSNGRKQETFTISILSGGGRALVGRGWEGRRGGRASDWRWRGATIPNGSKHSGASSLHAKVSIGLFSCFPLLLIFW